jgi:hypothetical protein
MKLTVGTKVLVVAFLIAGAGAAAWFLFLEDWVTGAPAASVAPAAKPPASVAKAPAPTLKPAVAVPVSTPAVSTPVILAQAPAPAPAPKEPPKAAEEDKPKPKPFVRKPGIKPDPAKEPDAKAEAGPPAPASTAQEPQGPVLVPARPMAAPSPRFNDLATAVIYGDAFAVHQLLAVGKWADKPDGRGVTPLMLAVERGDAASAEALLKAGANPNRPGPGGLTATSIARERKDAALTGLIQRYGGR